MISAKSIDKNFFILHVPPVFNIIMLPQALFTVDKIAVFKIPFSGLPGAARLP